MESKKSKTSGLEKIQKSNTPSAVDDAADVMSKYSNKKAEDELGLTWKSYDDCIHDTVEAYR